MKPNNWLALWAGYVVAIVLGLLAFSIAAGALAWVAVQVWAAVL